MVSNDWKIPLVTALGLHILVFGGVVYLPGIFKTTPNFATVHTVSIINIAESALMPPAAIIPKKRPALAAAKPLVKTKKIKPIPIAEVQSQKDSPSRQVVSLKPLRKKKVKRIKSQLPTQSSKEQARKKQIIAEKLRLARQALDAERRLLQAQQPTFSQQATTETIAKSNSSRASTPVSTTNLLQRQYLASLLNRLHQFWALPEYLQKGSNLTATVIVTINKDGTIADTFFENSSENKVFDQFVKKTIEAANPLPPIPPAMKRMRFEVGLRFQPGGIE